MSRGELQIRLENAYLPTVIVASRAIRVTFCVLLMTNAGRSD
jgi:hypothetical protein